MSQKKLWKKKLTGWLRHPEDTLSHDETERIVQSAIGRGGPQQSASTVVTAKNTATEQVVALDKIIGSGRPPLVPPVEVQKDLAPRLKIASTKYEESTQKLQEMLRKHADYGKFPEIESSWVEEALEKTNASKMAPGEMFGLCVEEVMSKKTEAKKTILSRIGRGMAKLYPILTLVLGVISFGADTAGFLPLKITANALAQAVSLASQVGSKSDIIITQLDEFAEIQFLTEGVRRLELDSSDPENAFILEHATLVMVGLNDFLSISIKSMSQWLVEKVAQQLVGYDEVEESKARLKTSVENLNLALSRAVDLLRFLKDKEEYDLLVLDRLSKLDFLQKHKDVITERLVKSQWIFKEKKFIKEWLEGKASVLWCYGSAGAGKTILLSTVLEYLLQKYPKIENHASTECVGIAYVYCEYNRQSEQSAPELIRSITRQLIERSPSSLYTSQVRRAENRLEQNQVDVIKSNDEPNNSNNHTESDDPDLVLLHSILEVYKHSFIVVDALDECSAEYRGQSNRQRFIDGLTSIDAKLGVKLLFTSRETIGKSLNNVKDLIPLEISPDPIDLGKYVDARIKKSSTLKGHIDKYGNLEKDILDTILSKYSKTFNLARLQMDRINNLPTPGDVREALQSVPLSEDEFYGKSVIQIKASNDVTSTLAKRLLIWILHSRRRLRFDELQLALAIRNDRVTAKTVAEYVVSQESLVEYCVGLVRYNSKTDDITETHPTIKEYLEDEKVSSDLFGLLNPAVEITRACLIYLSFDTFEAGPCITGSELANRLWKNPLFFYAAQEWANFARGDTTETALKSEIIKFLQDSKRVGSFTQTLDLIAVPDDRIPIPQIDQPLFIAARMGLAIITAAILKGDINIVNQVNSDKMTALHVAVEHGHVGVIKVLLENKADVKLRNVLGHTPLHIAASSGQINIVETLLNHVSRMKDRQKLLLIRDVYEYTAFHWAAAVGNENTLRALLKYGTHQVDQTKWPRRPGVVPEITNFSDLLEHNPEVNVRSILKPRREIWLPSSYEAAVWTHLQDVGGVLASLTQRTCTAIVLPVAQQHFQSQGTAGIIVDIMPIQFQTLVEVEMSSSTPL